MNTAYARDNTRSSLLVLLAFAFVATLIALVIGLSDKPNVAAIGIAAGPGDPASLTAADEPPTFGFDQDTADAGDAAGQPNTSDASTTDAAGTSETIDDFPADDAGTTDSDSGEAADLSAEAEERLGDTAVIVVPTAEPTATPEIAAAVEPTPTPAPEEEQPDPDTVLPAPSLPTSSGTVQGTFFTKVDENEGAVVTQNLITVSFAEDGSGAFQGVLEISYLDGTLILLNMSGPLTWAATNPQVEATLTGAFTLDAPIDADDITADDAELSISSLGAGSGSLCTSKCFGFTFPPQNGL